MLGERNLRQALNGQAIAIQNTDSEVKLIEINQDGSRGLVVPSKMSTDYLSKIEVGGQQGNILIGLDHGKKELLSCKIKDNLRIKVVGRLKLSSLMNEGDMTKTFAMSPCGEYVFVHTYNKSYKASKQLILSVNEAEIRLCASLELSNEGLGYFENALFYLKGGEDELIFKAIPPWISSPSVVLTFVYHKVTKELKELENHRTTLKDIASMNFTSQGDALYALRDTSSKLIMIT